jgi:hypothetical protein
MFGTGADGFVGSHLAERPMKFGADARIMVFEFGDGIGWLEKFDSRREGNRCRRRPRMLRPSSQDVDRFVVDGL